MKTILLRTGALALVAGLVACNGESATTAGAEDPQINADMAVVAADATSEDIELIGGPQGDFGFGFSGLPAFGRIRGPFACGSKERFGLTVDRTCTFKDAADATQTEYSPETTAQVDLDVTVKGHIDRGRWDADVDRTRHFEVSGLTGRETTRTWNGTGSGTVSRSHHKHGDTTRTYDLTYSWTVDDVVIPVPRSEHAWPTSGTITRHTSVHITGGPRDGQTVERDITITFDGTDTATLVINGETFHFSLKTRGLRDHDDRDDHKGKGR